MKKNNSTSKKKALDSVDCQMIELLQKDGRISNTDIALYLASLSENSADIAQIDLTAIPAIRRSSYRLPIIATLEQAHQTMRSKDIDLIHVVGAHKFNQDNVYGVITREHIERSYS